MSETLYIEYVITKEEWARTAALRWNEDIFPLYHCFFGLVSFRVGGQEVLGSGKFDMSVADLAVGLAELLDPIRKIESGVLTFQQSDDMLEIEFKINGQAVTISHNLAINRKWVCSRENLEMSILNFVRTFANEANQRIAALVEWRGMEILKCYTAQASRN